MVMDTHSSLPTLPLRRTENTLRQLLNDAKTVTEARCQVHGFGGGTTANSASVLLSLIALEIIAQRSAEADQGLDGALRKVFRDLADHVGYPPYAKVGFAVFKLCRNGLAHGFYPNEVLPTNGDGIGVVQTFWIDGESHRSVCVDAMAGNAESGHLSIRATSDSKLTTVCVQCLYRDVRGFVEDFLSRLSTDADLRQVVERRDEKLLLDARRRALEALSEADLISLGND